MSRLRYSIVRGAVLWAPSFKTDEDAIALANGPDYGLVFQRLDRKHGAEYTRGACN